MKKLSQIKAPAIAGVIRQKKVSAAIGEIKNIRVKKAKPVKDGIKGIIPNIAPIVNEKRHRTFINCFSIIISLLINWKHIRMQTY